jgi:hypothetical protein
VQRNQRPLLDELRDVFHGLHLLRRGGVGERTRDEWEAAPTKPRLCAAK